MGKTTRHVHGTSLVARIAQSECGLLGFVKYGQNLGHCKSFRRVFLQKACKQALKIRWDGNVGRDGVWGAVQNSVSNERFCKIIVHRLMVT